MDNDVKLEEELLKDFISNNSITIRYIMNGTGKIGDLYTDFEEFLKHQGKYEEFMTLPKDIQDLIRYLGYICLYDKRYDEALNFIKRMLP